MTSEPARLMFHQAEAEASSVATIRVLRRALAEASLTQAEFCRLWREAATNFTLRCNVVGLKLLLVLLSGAPSYPSLLGQLLFEEYNGLIALLEGHTDKALVHFEQQLILARRLAEGVEIVEATLNLALTHLTEFRLDQVHKALTTAHQMVKEQPNPALLVKILNREAELAAYQHRTARSVEKAEQALALARRYELPLEEAFALNWLGLNWMYWREMSRAERYLLESLQIRQQRRDVLGRAETLISLSRLYFKNNELLLTNNCVNGGLAIMRQLKNRPGIAQGLYWKAAVLYRSGQPETALPLAMEAVEIRLELGEATKLAEAFSLLGQIYAGLNNPKLALFCHRRVLELHQPQHDTPQWIEPLTATGDYLLRVKESDPDSRLDWERGLTSFRLAIEIIEQYQDLYYLAPALGRMARGLLRLAGLKGIPEAQRCYRLQLTLLGSMDETYFPTAEAIAQRAEALTGLQICASLLRRQDNPAHSLKS